MHRSLTPTIPPLSVSFTLVMAMFHYLVPLAFFMFLLIQAMGGGIDPNWYDARATFYGDASGAETMRKLFFNIDPTQLLKVIYF
jgi:hypothetical protein